MQTDRERLVQLLAHDGHRAEVERHDESERFVSVHFRARHKHVTVTLTDTDTRFFAVAIAFELPEWARDRTRSAPILIDLQASFKAVKFYFSDDGAALLAAVEQFSSSIDEFYKHVWRIVGVLHEAGSVAMERILDSSESKAAADKFIQDFMRGQKSE